MTDVYPYEDYRKFLAEAFEELKKEQGSFSHRDFAARAGFTNPGFFNDVVKGKRKLSKAAAGKMIQVFGLKPGEAEYFRLLVEYAQCKKTEQRQRLYEQMLFRRNRSSFVRLNPHSSKYYQDYHYPLIRAAIQVFNFRGDYETLSRFLRPSVPVVMIKKCLRELCEWGLVEQGKDGRYRVVHQNQEPPLSMGDLVKRLNREWVAQAADALFEFNKQERHISSSLLTVSAEVSTEIQRRIERFREDIFSLAKKEARPDRVMQFSIQFFPRTQAPEVGHA